MEIKKVLNDGKHLTQNNSIITFLTSKGNRTPKYIYVGFSDDGIELYDTTKKGCISKIERDNRLFISLNRLEREALCIRIKLKSV